MGVPHGDLKNVYYHVLRMEHDVVLALVLPKQLKMENPEGPVQKRHVLRKRKSLAAPRVS